MPEAIVTRVHRFADAQRRLVAERDGEHEVASRRVFALGDGERRGNDRRGRVHRRAFVDVVELEDVRRDAVRERRAGGRRSSSGKHRRFVRRRRVARRRAAPFARAARASRRAPIRASRGSTGVRRRSPARAGHRISWRRELQRARERQTASLPERMILRTSTDQQLTNIRRAQTLADKRGQRQEWDSWCSAAVRQ